jgi:putative FmdB family regulatory protein
MGSGIESIPNLTGSHPPGTTAAMPLYEYECTECHERTEKIQKFSDPEITVCPHCSGHLERVLSAPAIAFKGGGWYADGYGNSKPKTDSKTESKTESKSESKSEGSSSSNSGSSTNAASSTAAPAASSTTPAASSAK